MGYPPLGDKFTQSKVKLMMGVIGQGDHRLISQGHREGPTTWNEQICQKFKFLVLFLKTQYTPLKLTDKMCSKAFGERQYPSAPRSMNRCPFIGQQIGKCNSFPSTHYLAHAFAMHWGPRVSQLCVQHFIHFTYLSFQVNRPSHS